MHKWFIFNFCFLMAAQVYASQLKVHNLKNSFLNKSNELQGGGCDGKNEIPKITWDQSPDETEYVALTVHDPDAPREGGWWHWLILNIPARFHEISETNLREVLAEGAIQTITSFGKPGWGGPCPPKGETHHYNFTLYFLKDKIKISESATPGMVAHELKEKSIGSTEAASFYKR